MSTVRTEKEDTKNEKVQPREKGGQTPEDRAKGLEIGESSDSFDNPENNPKRKE